MVALTIIVRVLLVLSAIGCGTTSSAIAPHATPVAPLVDPPFAEIQLPVDAKAVTKERYASRDLFEPVIHGRDRIAKAAGWRSANPDIPDSTELDMMGSCARDYILAQVPTARRALVSAFAHYITTCDEETGSLVLERPLGFDSRDRRSRSDAVFLGAISSRGAGLMLRLTSCGSAKVFDRITIAGSGHRWTSTRLEVKRTFDGCDVAEIPYSPRLANTIIAATDREATISFDGGDGELEIDEALRDELRGVIDAVDAITEP